MFIVTAIGPVPGPVKTTSVMVISATPRDWAYEQGSEQQSRLAVTEKVIPLVDAVRMSSRAGPLAGSSFAP